MRVHNGGRRLVMAAGAAIMLTAGTVVVAPQAHARSLSARIDVDKSDMSAIGYVHDDVFDGRYTAVLTAVGPVVCGLTGPVTVIADYDTASGNPATPATDGTCANRYDGVVTYELEWVGVAGTSGHLTVVCTITLGLVVCTPPGRTTELPDTEEPS